MPVVAYAVLVLLWVGLIGAELVFVAPVAMALALVAGTCAGLGRFFLMAGRGLTEPGLAGLSPVACRGPAYRHYLLRQFWRDVAALFLHTVPWWLSRVQRAISSLTSSILTPPQGLFAFPVWLGLCAGLVLAGLPLVAAGVVFGAVTVVIAAAGLAGWSVCVAVLGSVERLWMAYRRILIACPHPGCYRRFALPTYACPRCDRRHPRLVPGLAGAFRHVCRCGARLPTTILLGRFRLAAYCPHCERPLPGRIGRARVEPLPIVGGPAAGKTTLMRLAVGELAEAAPQRAGAPQPPGATMLDLPSAGRILYLFDPAGELHTGATQVERLGYLDHGEALLFVIDPFALPELRPAMSQEERRLAPATSEEDPSDTLQRLLAELRSREDQGRQRRIAVVVTKTDLLRRTGVGRDLADPGADVRGWLEGVGLGNTIRTLEHAAGQVRYFASGLDSEPGALAELLAWAADVPLNGSPRAAEPATRHPVTGRPADAVPLGHQVGRWALLAGVTVLGPLTLLAVAVAAYARLH